MASNKITAGTYQTVIQETFDDWADFLGVKHQWAIELAFKKANDMQDADSSGECSWPSNYRSAVIRFNMELIVKKQLTIQEMRETVVHELGHLVNADIWDLINDNFQGGVRKMLLDQCEKEIDMWTRIVMRAREEGEEDDGVVSDGPSPSGASPEDGVWTAYS